MGEVLQHPGRIGDVGDERAVGFVFGLVDLRGVEAALRFCSGGGGVPRDGIVDDQIHHCVVGRASW